MIQQSQSTQATAVVSSNAFTGRSPDISAWRQWLTNRYVAGHEFLGLGKTHLAALVTANYDYALDEVLFAPELTPGLLTSTGMSVGLTYVEPEQRVGTLVPLLGAGLAPARTAPEPAQADKLLVYFSERVGELITAPLLDQFNLFSTRLIGEAWHEGTSGRQSGLLEALPTDQVVPPELLRDARNAVMATMRTTFSGAWSIRHFVDMDRDSGWREIVIEVRIGGSDDDRFAIWSALSGALDECVATWPPSKQHYGGLIGVSVKVG